MDLEGRGRVELFEGLESIELLEIPPRRVSPTNSFSSLRSGASELNEIFQ